MAFVTIAFGLPLAFRLPVVRDHLSTSKISVEVEDDLQTVAQLLSRNRITAAPIVEDDTVVGILSRNDLLRAICTVSADASDEAKEEGLERIKATRVWKVCEDRAPRASPNPSPNPSP
jgi:predicted transcriptional regulator